MRYTERLNDGRCVYLNGKKIENVAHVKEFKGTINLIQKIYDNEEYYIEDEYGEKFSATLLIPRSKEDIRFKGNVYKKISEESFGMLGRTPDFINAALSGLYSHAEFLGTSEYTDFRENAKNLYKRVKDKNLFLSHGAINAQIDRSKSISEIDNKYVGVYSKKHNSKGIWVNGAKMIVTLSPLADELLIFNMPGLTKADKDFALAFTVPVNAKGLKIICRKPFYRHEYNLSDYPMTNLIDEIDAYVVLENVFVPWEHVLVYKDIDISNSFFDKSFMRHHSGHQDIVRGYVKLNFIVGVFITVTELLGLDSYLPVQEKLGRALTNLELIKASVYFAENMSEKSLSGVYIPHIDSIMSIRYNLPIMYSQIIEDILKVCGGSMLSTPSFRDFMNENKDILSEALYTKGVSAEMRVKILNLAWDISGDSSGQRQMNYEYFHGGDPMRIAAQYYKNYDKSCILNNIKAALAIKGEN